MSNPNVKYDVSKLDPLERSALREVLTEKGIRFQLNLGLLIVYPDDEAVVDENLAKVEKVGSELRAQALAAPTSGRISSGIGCQICGRTPAAPIVLRRQVGMVIVATTHTIDAVLCDQCAQAATRDFQKQTAIKGWTGVRSALTNPIVIATNARNRKKHRNQLGGR